MDTEKIVAAAKRVGDAERQLQAAQAAVESARQRLAAERSHLLRLVQGPINGAMGGRPRKTPSSPPTRGSRGDQVLTVLREKGPSPRSVIIDAMAAQGCGVRTACVTISNLVRDKRLTFTGEAGHRVYSLPDQKTQ